MDNCTSEEGYFTLVIIKVKDKKEWNAFLDCLKLSSPLRLQSYRPLLLEVISINERSEWFPYLLLSKSY